jgi:hypothetical protein
MTKSSLIKKNPKAIVINWIRLRLSKTELLWASNGPLLGNHILLDYHDTHMMCIGMLGIFHQKVVSLRIVLRTGNERLSKIKASDMLPVKSRNAMESHSLSVMGTSHSLYRDGRGFVVPRAQHPRVPSDFSSSNLHDLLSPRDNGVNNNWIRSDILRPRRRNVKSLSQSGMLLGQVMRDSRPYQIAEKPWIGWELFGLLVEC